MKKPSPGDVAMDLQRCYEVNLSTNSFSNDSFNTFFRHALGDLKKTKGNLDTITLKNVQACLSKVLDKNLEITKRRDSLLTASNLLLHS